MTASFEILALSSFMIEMCHLQENGSLRLGFSGDQVDPD
jgi:hypothetical protein